MNKRILSIFIFTLLVVGACSRKKNTAISRAYHNMTSRYNGYFNAREIMKEEELKLKDSFEDDYSQLLPIFVHPSEEVSQSLYPPMDRVIEKCSEVIDRHSIYKKKKEYIKWIDDSYQLIGKARFYKGEFGLAEETFLYVYQAYKKDPARYDGFNWLIKTFIETRQFDKAEEFLDLGDELGKKFPEEYIGHFNAIYADYYLKKDNDYENAIEKLETAIKYTKKKEIRRRYTYVLAQLYQEQRNFSLASDRYSRVLKLNPDYIMRFNARISRAIAYDVSSNNSEAIKKELRKMLKDSKNEEFRDQIYYALAELALKEDDEPLAIQHLRKSVKFSVKNNRQKGLSYLKLANIFFDQPDYLKAQENYDSTLQFLPDDHPDYYEADEKNNSLQELVKNLKIIVLQDSLLAISSLSKKDQKRKVKEIIKKLKDEEDRKKQEQLRQVEAAQEGLNPDLINTTSGGKRGEWYFYNATTLSIGVSEFKNIWGDTPLNDDWRRNKKNTTIIINEETPTEEENEQDNETIEVADEDDKFDEDEYLSAIPQGFQEQLEAHGQVVEALFNVGTIFKESFDDSKSAIDAYNRIVTEYDTSKYNLPAHYQLYRIYLINNVPDKAEEQKKWVLDNHPFSEYAYLIKNPEYSKQTKATKEKVEEFYAATYNLFRYKLYQDVINSVEKAEKTFSKNHIKAKFDFLRAKSIGHIKSREEFKVALEQVVKDHPEDPVTNEAQSILDYMKNIRVESRKEIVQKINFDYNPSDKQIFILSTSSNSPTFKQLQNQLSNFNQQYFRESALQVTSSKLKEKELYLIRTFDSQEEGIRYLKALKNNKKMMFAIQQANATEYLISNTNFKTLFKTKDEEAYLNFFNEKYPI